MANEEKEIQEMDTTAATTDPTRKRRRDLTSCEDAGDSARKTVIVTASASQRAATGSASDIDDDEPVDDGAEPFADNADGEEEPSSLCPGWTEVVSRRAKKKQRATGTSSQQGSPLKCKPSTSNSASNSKAKEGGQRAAKAQFVAKVNANMAKTARMPSFANKDEIRVVIRPRGGLVIAKTPMSTLRGAIFAAANVASEEAEEDSMAPNAAQNIVVLSTPNEKRATKYGMIRSITIGEETYESYAYWATPDNTSRGVISGVGHDESEEDIRRRIVNKYNPTAMAAHRLGNSTSVVILFEGQKVPHYIKYGGFITKCTLYRQHREVCKICGQVGHRKDVCPTPNARVCFACGRKNPGEDHAEYCKPKCRLCGGSHVTGAGSCKNKFKTPLQIKKRQWARQTAVTQAANKMAPAPLQPALKVRLSRTDEFPELESRQVGSNAEQRDWRIVTSGDSGPTWADVTTGGTKTTRRQRSALRRRQQQRAESSSGAAVTGERAQQAQRERSASRRRGASRSDSTPRHVASTHGDGGCSNGCGDYYKKAMEELKKAMKEMRDTLQSQQAKMTAMQLTIAQQRNTIAQLKAGKPLSTITTTTVSAEQQRNGAQGSPQRTPINYSASTTIPKTFQFSAKASPPKTREEIVAAARKNEEHVNEDEEISSASDSEDEDDELDSVSVKTSASSTATTKTGAKAAAKQPLGYAGLNKRIRQLTTITSRWGKNLENLEQRLLNKITQSMQQQQQQLQQQIQLHMQQQQQQHIEQLSPERLQPLVEAAVQRYCNAGASPPSSQ